MQKGKLLLLLFAFAGFTARAQTDLESMSRAVEYFQSGKYHEALLLFERLGRHYRLNPRFKAYAGVCYFYEKDYAKTVETFDSVMPQLDTFAPHERSVYCYCAAESNYRQKKYREAIAMFEKQLLLCYDNEKGDALLRIGMCYRLLGETLNAQEYLVEALAYYRKYNDEYKLARVEKEMKMLD